MYVYGADLVCLAVAGPTLLNLGQTASRRDRNRAMVQIADIKTEVHVALLAEKLNRAIVGMMTIIGHRLRKVDR